MEKKSIFVLGKSLKQPKMQFHDIFFIVWNWFLLISRFFFWPGLFFNFLAHCGIQDIRMTEGIYNLMTIIWTICFKKNLCIIFLTLRNFFFLQFAYNQNHLNNKYLSIHNVTFQTWCLKFFFENMDFWEFWQIYNRRRREPKIIYINSLQFFVKLQAEL